MAYPYDPAQRPGASLFGQLMVPQAEPLPSLVQVPEEPRGILGRIGSALQNPRLSQQLLSMGTEMLANSGYQSMPVTTGAGIGRGLQAFGQAGQRYDQMIGQQAADAFNKRAKELEMAKLQAETDKLNREASNPADVYGTTFGDSAEGRQLAVLARQYAEQNGVDPQTAIFAVSRWNQEQAPSAVAIPAGGELREVRRPSLFGQQAPQEQAPALFAPGPAPGLNVGPPIASRPPAPEKPKELPQYLVNLVQENNSKLRMLTNISELVNDPEAASALGKKNMIPGMDMVGKYFRSGKQNDLAGMISGLQSMTYKDISGANVTASEEPRLKRYVPDVTDDPETVKRKVDNFINEYRTILSEVEQIAKDQGYKPVSVQTPTQQPKPTSSRLDKVRAARGGK